MGRKKEWEVLKGEKKEERRMKGGREEGKGGDEKRGIKIKKEEDRGKGGKKKREGLKGKGSSLRKGKLRMEKEEGKNKDREGRSFERKWERLIGRRVRRGKGGTRVGGI